MSRKKRFKLIFLSLVGFLVLFGAWYQYTYSMSAADPFQINSSNHNRKLLIATQGSEFKNNLTKTIVDYFKSDSIFIDVIDVSFLNDVQPEKYTAILLIHTWENWKPPGEVKQFIDRTTSYKNRILAFTTSGDGSYKMAQVDAISGESKLEHIERYAHQIIKKLKPLLKS